MIVLDPDGDIVFELQDHSILVSSKVLCLSSPTFAKMLKSAFKEGIQPAKTPPLRKTIALPADDFDAFLLYCKILHFQEISPQPPSKVLASLAVLCDKYDFAQAITSWSSLWLQKWARDTSVEDLSNLLVLAYVLKFTEAFSEISKAILLSHVGDFDHLVFSDHVLVRSGLAAVFDARRTEIKIATQGIVISIASDLGRFSCEQAELYTGKYMRELISKKVVPLGEANVDYSLTELVDHALTIDELKYRKCSGRPCSDWEWDGQSLRGALQKRLEQFMKRPTGLCLVCFVSNGASKSSESCQSSGSHTQ